MIRETRVANREVPVYSNINEKVEEEIDATRAIGAKQIKWGEKGKESKLWTMCDLVILILFHISLSLRCLGTASYAVMLLGLRRL